MKPVAVLFAALPFAAALAASPVKAAEPLRVHFTTATPPAAQGDPKAEAEKLKRERVKVHGAALTLAP